MKNKGKSIFVKGKLKKKLKGKSELIFTIVCLAVVATTLTLGIAKHKEVYLDMTTIIDYKVTEKGELYLYTDNGNGYYFTKKLESIKEI